MQIDMPQPAGPATSRSRHSLIQDLQHAIHACLKNEFTNEPFAIVDFPDIRNPGDSAIWLGQIAYIAKMHKKYPDYVAKMRDFSPEALLRAVPFGTIFITGGGTFGDIWVGHQNFREHLLKRFPAHRIVQFPQSIHFESPQRLDKAARLIDQHGNFRLLVRDRQSESIARRHFNCEISLCPDMALWLGPLTPSLQPHIPVLGVLRSDKEKAVSDWQVPPDIVVEDWIAEAAWKISAAKAFGGAVSCLRGGDRTLGALNRAAESRVRRGITHLSRAQAIISDRLHVHIFSLLLGRPHAVLDNSYGKVGAAMEAFSGGSAFSYRAASIEDAIDWAKSHRATRTVMRIGNDVPSMNVADTTEQVLAPPAGAPLLTFIIPVRHQDNARDWPSLKENLAQTIASIANQDHPDWEAVIVANEGADLPALPPKFRVRYVNFPPNKLHDRKRAKDNKEAFLDAFRFDKGRRALAGMLAARESTFFMIVDDDDFVSARLAGYVAAHPDCNGWHINKGYIWNSGGRFLMATNELGRLCGTSLIVRAAFYQLPAKVNDASAEFIKTMIGSHRRIAEVLKSGGTPLLELPFRGTVYRVASPGSHSGTPSFFVRYGLTRNGLRNPLKFVRNLAKLRFPSHATRREFGLPG